MHENNRGGSHRPPGGAIELRLPVSGQRLLIAVAVGLLIAMATGFFGPAWATAKGDNGDVKTHNASTSVTDQRDEPKVCSPFYLDAFNFDGHQQVNWHIVNDTHGATVLSGTITLGADGNGHTGNLTLDEGMYKLYWNWDGENGSAKHKVFKVKCGDETPPTTGTTSTTTSPTSTTSTTTQPTTTTTTTSASLGVSISLTNDCVMINGQLTKFYTDADYTVTLHGPGTYSDTTYASSDDGSFAFNVPKDSQGNFVTGEYYATVNGSNHTDATSNKVTVGEQCNPTPTTTTTPPVTTTTTSTPPVTTTTTATQPPTTTTTSTTTSPTTTTSTTTTSTTPVTTTSTTSTGTPSTHPTTTTPPVKPSSTTPAGTPPAKTSSTTTTPAVPVAGHFGGTGTPLVQQPSFWMLLSSGMALLLFGGYGAPIVWRRLKTQGTHR